MNGFVLRIETTCFQKMPRPLENAAAIARARCGRLESQHGKVARAFVVGMETSYVKKLAELFKVSRLAMGIRLKQLGIIPAWIPLSAKCDGPSPQASTF